MSKKKLWNVDSMQLRSCFTLLILFLFCITPVVTAIAAPSAETTTTNEARYEEDFAAAAQEVDVPPHLTKAIARVESGVTPWTLNIAGRSYFFDSKEEALAAAERAQAAGKSFDTGIMQVNNWWLKRYDIPLDAALDPSANILLGSWVLKQALLEHPTDTWAAVGKYHSPNANKGKRYAAQVRRALERGPVSSRKAAADSPMMITKPGKRAPDAAKRDSGANAYNKNVTSDLDAPLVVYVKPKPVFTREAPTEETKEALAADTVKTEATAETAEVASHDDDGSTKTAKAKTDKADSAEVAAANTPEQTPAEAKGFVPAVLVRELPPDTGRFVFTQEHTSNTLAQSGSEFVRRMQ